MAKDRARRRAEREAEAAREREQRARQRARQQRLDRGKDALGSLIPDKPSVKPGLLAARRRRRLWIFFAVIVAIQVIAWPFLPSWGARLLLLGLTLVAAPIVWVLSFGRV